MTERNQELIASLDADQVAAYLRQHPEFFVEHDELIPEMRTPYQPGGVVSLVEHRMRLLRERNTELRHRLSRLMDVARENDRLFDKTRRLVLDLLDVTSLEDVVSTVEDSLRYNFQVPYVGLILFSDANLAVGRSVNSAEAHQAIGSLLSSGKVVCGMLRPHELAFLFGESERDKISSAAMACLNFQGLHGVLAIGSPDPQHYKSSLGTLFLGYIAEILARVLSRFFSPLRSIR